MTQNNQPSDALRKEAEDYVAALPDETAEGRLVDDDGTAANESEWQSEEAKQQAALKKSDD
ncbi:MAG TPA: hypothetical protein VGF84_11830 [Micromonosporaceae bacterium]|jgi:hypothetical protein